MSIRGSLASADIGEAFLKTAERLGSAPALIHRGETATFTQLAEQMERLAHGFVRAGAGRAARVAVLVPPSRDFFAAAFALFRAGAVPVLIDPGIGFKSLKRCLADAAPDAFLGSPKAHAARVLGRWAPTARIKIVCGSPSFGLPKLAEFEDLGTGRAVPLPVLSASDRAAILFTSGGTGAPKGAVYEHGMFTAQVELLRGMFDIKDGDVSLATFPLFGLFDLVLGSTVVIPEMDFTRPGFVDPMAIIAPIQRHQVRQLFGSPALLDRVGRYGERHGVALPSLTRVLSAGAPVPARVLERFTKMLEPGVEIHTPYGATEALPVALASSSEILGETAAKTAAGAGVCVGRPVKGVETAVIRIDDAPIKLWSESLRLPVGAIGEIAVKGPMVTTHYFNRVDETALVKIGDEKGFWHRMGDLGYFDEGGRLWFCGRKVHRVKTDDGDMYTIPVEGIFNTHPGVRRTALVGVHGKPVLCVELEPGTKIGELTKELLVLGSRYPQTAKIQTILYHPSFPVDIRHNAKIFRDKLAVWAEAELKS
jgi:acyl-CoA synthetase (AMP-forming)/AMP-acid ligase II